MCQKLQEFVQHYQNDIINKNKNKRKELTASGWLGHPYHSQPYPWLLAGHQSS
jgi:hypothetical protein